MEKKITLTEDKLKIMLIESWNNGFWYGGDMETKKEDREKDIEETIKTNLRDKE
jgi:hypothetical protein